jgi:hypothetical protein
MRLNFNKSILVVATIVASALIISGCKKSATVENDINVNLDVASYSSKLMTTPEFADFVKVYTINLSRLKSLAFANTAVQANLSTQDSALAKSYNANILGALSIFMSTNKTFFSLSQENMKKVTDFITTSLASPDYRRDNPAVVEKLLTVEDAVETELDNSHSGTIKVQENSTVIKKTNKVSSELIIGCAIGTLCGAALAYESAINEIRGLFGQGWSWGGIVSIALDILQNASPWWKVGVIAVAFGACVYAGS